MRFRLCDAGGRGGEIVNIGSIAALSGQPYISAYCASKAALVVLSKNLANALRDRIRVNVLNIGWTNTPTEHAVQTGYHKLGDNWLEWVSKKISHLAGCSSRSMWRKASSLLASDESSLMTGAVVDFDSDGDRNLRRQSHLESPDLLWTISAMMVRDAGGSEGDFLIVSPRSLAATRFRPGHPEGYALAFANLCSGFARAVIARKLGDDYHFYLAALSQTKDGVAVAHLIDAPVRSHRDDSMWVHSLS